MNPPVHFSFGASIDIILRRVVRENAALFDGDQILRVQGVVFGLALGRNFVVGLREDTVEGSERRIETVSAKREYLGHEFSGGFAAQQLRQTHLRVRKYDLLPQGL